MSNKHSFRAENGSALGQVIHYLKGHRSLSVQDGVRTGLLALHYPDVLMENKASIEEVLKALEDSIQVLTGTLERHNRMYQRLQTQHYQGKSVPTMPREIEAEESIPTFLDISM